MFTTAIFAALVAALVAAFTYSSVKAEKREKYWTHDIFVKRLKRDWVINCTIAAAFTVMVCIGLSALYDKQSSFNEQSMTTFQAKQNAELEKQQELERLITEAKLKEDYKRAGGRQPKW